MTGKSISSENRLALYGLMVIASFGGALFIRSGDVYREIVTLPGVAALFAALWQLMRDDLAHSRSMRLQREQEILSIGATSHMANVAFDKHAEFCEKYMKEVHSLMDTLFRKGPTEEALNHYGNFFNLRRDYAAWVSTDIALALDPFEKAVKKGGALSHYIRMTEATRDGRQAHKRDDAITESSRILYQILDMNDEDSTPDPDISAERVMEKLRTILGIEEFTKVRQSLVQRSLRGIDG